ncbi:predicted protein [Aspergillus terreus NIH2624]|uniref:FAD/NAD(P)-binding domain-containing protein n=1 Tax=Aspergillus terreus (strain NIH 2624 / FGSC A1156) TaxID=341663 RepID=Q0CM58_ASPTN|nr:uncharacterized protein ATEG_05226 [Aspergillus terreus NIH2624]EAU34295.1 predicted protein [Aspergillus terreus NIH2624]
MASKESPPFKRVVIVGAGFSGLAMACQLKQKLRCHDFVIYDRGAGFGGTWLFNTYPGCGVDIPAVLYSLSYAQNPDFSNFFPKQDEVLQYMNDVVDRFDLSGHLVGNTDWIGASWQDDTKAWLVKLKDLSSGQEYVQRCSILISAVGALTNPNPFYAPGIDRFQGNIIHTARWDHSVSLRDKDVIVIGNGVGTRRSRRSPLYHAIHPGWFPVPQVWRNVANQPWQSSQYVLPGGDNTIITPFWRTVFRYLPGVLRSLRLLTFLYLETSTPQFDTTEQGAKMRTQTAKISERYIKATAPAHYWPLLMPDHEVGCKRRVFDHNGYIASLNRENVHLTDDPIVAVNERSVVTKSGTTYPADVIALANGFALTQFDADLRGRHGRSRSEHWKDVGYIEAFHSIGMAGFPNFFYILGPNSGRGHTSAVLSIESYTNLISRVIKPVIAGSALSVEPKSSSEKEYNERLHGALEKTVFTNACRSWYIDPKTGYNWAVYPWSSFYMWWTTQVAGLSGWVYELPKGKPKSATRPFLLSVALSVFMVTLALWLYDIEPLAISSIEPDQWIGNMSRYVTFDTFQGKL